MSISEALFAVLLAGLQIYVSLRLIGRGTTWWKVLSFALLHASSVIMFSYIFHHIALQFLAISLSYFVYFTWIFGVTPFSDALAVYLTIHVFQGVGDLVFQLSLRYLPINSDPSAILLKIGPHWPFAILSIHYFASDLSRKGDEKSKLSCNSTDCLIAYGIVGLAYYLTNPTAESLFLDMFLAACLITLPLACYALQRNNAKKQKIDRSLHYHARQHAIQKSATKALREERHEFVNELTLISTYLQMGKVSEALTCIDYTSARLADRNNYAVLPHDAWLTILELKQSEAKHRQLDFRVHILGEEPRCFKEQRLLPRLIINLIDNAFEAVANQPDPKVSLSWSVAPTGERLLKVSNNGPEISPWEGARIFRGGVTTKQRSKGNHGWGLVICKDIANELQGSLTYQSSPQQTTFTLTLPPADPSCEQLEISS